MSGSSGKNDNGPHSTPVKVDSARSRAFADRSFPSASLGSGARRGVSDFERDSLELERSESQETLNNIHRLRRIEEEHEDFEMHGVAGSVITDRSPASFDINSPDIEKLAGAKVTTRGIEH